MPISFPSNPSLNQTYTVGSRTWQWDGSSWKVVAIGRAAVAQDTAPSNPLVGQMWFDTANGIQYTYFNDGSSSQWVETGWAGQLTNIAAGGDLTGTYPNPTIAANAVTTADIADSAVTSAKIADGTITTTDFASSVGNFGAWTSYTPTVTQSGTVTISGSEAAYVQFGKLVVVRLRIIISGTGTAGTAVSVTLPPVSRKTSVTDPVMGTGYLYDTSAGTNYGGQFYSTTTTTVNFIGDWSGASQGWGNTPNIAIAGNDQISGFLLYEAA